MSSNGAVVGVADGGLRGGAARINWAMPANFYVPRLASSIDPIPSSPSVQVSLYSNRTTVDADASEAEEIMELQREAKENTVENGEQSVTLTWTASYEDLFSTMTAEEQREMQELTNSLSLDLSGATFNIYEDYETGATIAVPGGAIFEVEDGWFYSSNEDETLTYDALPFFSENYAAAKQNVYDVYIENFLPTDWVADP
ncbi:MAG: hypothetical protein IPH45_07690 [Bacteroidales bacterium]|nr:hypothetical protein [Bacteroidales bacterium]